ncbi:MAG: ATP synthase F0 subunit C [Deltaproteobacteria bacterium]|jgi:F-type H+-transporting ATPase subunit c|nr:ATP synthase F0 subunit C [Deltaproteobacteria bacterium]
MFKYLVFILTFVTFLAFSGIALAATPELSVAYLQAIGNLAIAAGIGIGLGVLGPGVGQGLTMLGALTGMARNPETTGTLRVYMLIGLALIESLAIYALVVALILIYAFPYLNSAPDILGSLAGAATP